MEKDDIERHFGPALRNAGFRYATVVNGQQPAALRVFAVKEGSSELPVDRATGPGLAVTLKPPKGKTDEPENT